MKRLFIVPILIFASFLVLVYAVLPQFSAVRQAKKQFAKAEQDLKYRQNYYIQLENALLEGENYKDTLQEISAVLPGEIFLPGLIDFFDQKSQTNGLTLKAFSISQTVAIVDEKAVKKDTIPSQNFLLALSGDVVSFEAFLKDIETSARLVNVEQINFHKNESSDSSEINLTVKVYY